MHVIGAVRAGDLICSAAADRDRRRLSERGGRCDGRAEPGLYIASWNPDTRASADTTGQLVSAAGGVISGAVTGRLTKRGQQIFKLDRFQIDPVFEGSTLSTFRTTIGKQITQDLAVTSSISLDSKNLKSSETWYPHNSSS